MLVMITETNTSPGKLRQLIPVNQLAPDILSRAIGNRKS